MHRDRVKGLSISHSEGNTRLKWHRLRRSVADPIFSLDALEEGLALGASLEIDLRVRIDGGFAVVHDETLDRETTGKGPVLAIGREELGIIAYDDMRHGPVRRVLTSEDLAAALRGADKNALLQFDMKDDLTAVGALGLDHLAEYFADASVPIIVSGDDPALIAAIGQKAPRLLRGIDPTDRLVSAFRRDGPDGVARALIEELHGPTEPDTLYLARQLVLAARAEGLDLIAMVQAAGCKVDVWTFTLADADAGFSDKEWTEFSTLLGLGPDQITTDEPMATERAYRARLAVEEG